MAESEIPISKTKIILPRRRVDLLSRSRLLDILNERLDRRLIIVSAPAGYGKTSLLIDLAHQSELAFCWLNLDPLDTDPQRFLAYLIAALEERFPQFGRRSRSVLNGLTGIEEGLEPLLVTLVNEIHDEIPEHFVLVLDDYHFLDGAAPIQSFINRLVRLMDDNCHVVLSSRTLPELPDIPLLVARDDVGGLDLSDLAFRSDEIQALLAQNRQTALSDEEARRLVEATEGWISAIQFADLKLLRAGKSPFQRPHALGVSVFDYLGRQVLDQQPEELQRFLLRTSLLEEFDAALCEAVLAPLFPKPPDWSAMLETVRQKNLFALPVGANGQWLRYHHLFRDYLEQQFRTAHPNEVELVLERLAEVREQHAEWEAAYHLRKQLGDVQALANLVERAGTTMYLNAMLTLESWLSDLPPSVIAQRPGLLSLRGLIAHMRGHAREGVQLLEEAIGKLQGKGDLAALALAHVRRGHAYRFLGSYAEAIQDAVGTIKITAEKDDMRGTYAEGLRLRGLCLFRQGHTLQAVEDLETALDIHVRINSAATIPDLLMETAMVQAALGEHRKAKAAYEKALEIVRRSQNPFVLANLLNNFGVLHYQLGEYENASQAFEEGTLFARQCGYKRMEALISISMGDLYSEIEDFEIAAQNYLRAQNLTQQLGDRFLTHYLMIAEANLDLLKRDPARARGILERASTAIRASDSSYEYGHLQLALGRLALQDGDAGQALAALADAKRCFAEDGREMESIWCSVWLAAAHCRQGETRAAVEEIGNAAQSPGQINHSAVVAARQAGDWLDVLRNDRDARAPLRGLYERMDRLDDRLPGIRRQLRRMARTLEIPAPTLTIHAFGRTQVWVNGRLVSAKDWQTQAVRELFFYFLAMNKPVTKEQVASVLWPDTSDPARLRLRFKNEIYRLRRAVGQNTILYEDEYYQLNPLIDHEYDVESFEAYVDKAKSAALPSERMSFYRKAVDLVGGQFLEDIGAVWVAPERERLQQTFISALLSLAKLYFEDGQTAPALQVCQRIIDQESTSEAAYRLKMHIHRRLGDKAALIRTYRDCEENLQDVFGMPPSDETKDLYRKLVS
jgi:ATP/maltotriose-dependent transcriptional regulator MalT/DNA-binding SARP family transcriptional activator